MPISGGPPGLTFNFEREAETVLGTSTLVLGDAKILSSMYGNGSDCELQMNRTGGTWTNHVTPALDLIEAASVGPRGGYFVSIEAGEWRINNTNANDRLIQLSVINVG